MSLVAPGMSADDVMSALAAAVVAGVVIGMFMVVVTLFYGRR